MPPRPLRADLPTFYLDQSTLSYAYSAAARMPGVPVEYQQLEPWVRRIATEANLCLSLVHVEELAAWGNTAAASEMAVWLDGLDTVWVRPLQYVARDEEDALVLRLAEVDSSATACPFANGFIAAFENATPEQRSAMQATPTISAAVSAYRRAARDQLRSLMPESHAALRSDREQAATAGVTEERLRARLALNHRTDLRRRAMESHERLKAANSSYAEEDVDLNDIVDPFERAVSGDPSAMPTWAVIRRYLEGFESGTENRQPHGRGTTRLLEGGAADLLHAAVGGGYCDTFTCDGTTAGWLGEVRQSLGHGPPIFVNAGGPGEFVDALTSTWP